MYNISISIFVSIFLYLFEQKATLYRRCIYIISILSTSSQMYMFVGVAVLVLAHEVCLGDYMIKGSLEEILPSYEKLRSVCVHVRDAKKSWLTVACVGTLGAAQFWRVCGAIAAPTPVEIEV